MEVVSVEALEFAAHGNTSLGCDPLLDLLNFSDRLLDAESPNALGNLSLLELREHHDVLDVEVHQPAASPTDVYAFFDLGVQSLKLCLELVVLCHERS